MEQPNVSEQIKGLNIRRLTPEEKELIAQERRDIIERLRTTPSEGTDIEYLGKQFRVLPGVFWPRNDSKPLVENFVINGGEEVCDVCTGSGVIAINAAFYKPSKVVAMDINPDAIKCVNLNAKTYGVDGIVDARISDVFSALSDDEKFDVVTCNPPFTDEADDTDFASKTLRDPGLQVHMRFFAGLEKHLKEGGRVYVAQANSGNIDDMLSFANEAGFKIKLIGERAIENSPLVFYAFELTRE